MLEDMTPEVRETQVTLLRAEDATVIVICTLILILVLILVAFRIWDGVREIGARRLGTALGSGSSPKFGQLV